jgi:dihydrofolate reductase
LIYSAICSLDGYVADRSGGFGWAMPDDELHAAVNEVMRPIGTHLYGRRMYETMAAWETMPTGPEESAVTNDFASMWRAAEKVVFSRTLDGVTTERTRLERSFEPERVRALKASADADLLIGGPVLAGQALSAGDLVDEIGLFLHPVIVGGGLRALPADDGLLSLKLIGERRFGSGVVGLRYRAADRRLTGAGGETGARGGPARAGDRRGRETVASGRPARAADLRGRRREGIPNLGARNVTWGPTHAHRASITNPSDASADWEKVTFASRSGPRDGHSTRASSTIATNSASSCSSSPTVIDSLTWCGPEPPLASATTSVDAAR